MNLEQVKGKINQELLSLFGTGSHQTRKWLGENGFKYCPACKEIRSFDDFYPDKHNEGGLRAYCKTCNTKKNVKWNRENYKSKRSKSKIEILDDLEVLFQQTKGQKDDWHKYGLAVFEYLTKLNVEIYNPKKVTGKKEYYEALKKLKEKSYE